MLKYFLLPAFLFILCAEYAKAQHIRYDETFFGHYLPSPPYIGYSCYYADSLGRYVKDFLGVDQEDSNISNVHYENVYSGLNDKAFFQTRFLVSGQLLLSKHILVVKNTAGLITASNLRDSAYIFYTYDSSSGAYQVKTKRTQLVNNGKATNYEQLDYFYDTGYRDSLIIARHWDTDSSKWRDTAMHKSLYPYGNGVPDMVDHYTYSAKLKQWNITSRDTFWYDAAVNKHNILKVNHNGAFSDSSMRYIHKIATDTIENYHWVFENSKWVKDTVVILHYNYNGIASKLFKIYSPTTELVTTAIKVTYGNPYYEGMESPEGESTALHIFPNPAISSFTLEYSLPQRQDVAIAIYNSMGKEALHISRPAQALGKHIEPINIESLAPGIYFVKVQAGSMLKEEKLIKIKN